MAGAGLLQDCFRAEGVRRGDLGLCMRTDDRWARGRGGDSDLSCLVMFARHRSVTKLWSFLPSLVRASGPQRYATASHHSEHSVLKRCLDYNPESLRYRIGSRAHRL
jgi:hypothetical protein